MAVADYIVRSWSKATVTPSHQEVKTDGARGKDETCTVAGEDASDT